MNHSHPVLRQQETPKRVYNIATKDGPIPVEEEVEALMPEPGTLDDITAVVVNYQTEQLIEVAVASFREFYPDVHLVISDNNSTDGSWEWIKEQEDEVTKVVLNEANIGHGPALNSAFIEAATRFVFTFDSDVTFLREGLLEQMLLEIEDAYAIGWLRWVNRSGVSVLEGKPFNKDRFCPYIHPYAALYNRNIYLSLAPFGNRGAPAVVNMHDAKKNGIEVKPFVLTSYVSHLVAGTRRMWRGKWNPGEREKERKWKSGSTFPI